MAEPGRSSRFARWVDDYVEEVAVGTPWWVLILAFGLSLPIVGLLASSLFRAHYPTGAYGVFLFVGAGMGAGLRLIARERERYRAAALGRSGDLEALREISWQDFEIVVGELIRRLLGLLDLPTLPSKAPPCGRVGSYRLAPVGIVS
jgi:hypothetical protein